jgi:hypothetical protein
MQLHTVQSSLPADEIITTRVLAARIHKSTRWVQAAVKDGHLPAIRIRRSVLFDWNAVLKRLREFEVR